MFDEFFMKMFVSAEHADAFVNGVCFTWACLAMIVFLIGCGALFCDLLLPWLRRKLKLNECKDGEKKC